MPASGVVAVTIEGTGGSKRYRSVGPYTAEVDREDRWWLIHILELDVVTQAARWSEVEAMARGVIVAELDLDEDAEFDLELVPVFDDEAGELLAQAQQQEQQARQLATAATTARRYAVQSLRQAGWTLQGIAAGLGMSYQRVEQVLKAETKNSARAEAISNRSARTGRYVSGAAVAREARTTVREAASKNRSSGTAHRSATTGRYVTKSTARRRLNTIIAENRRRR